MTALDEQPSENGSPHAVQSFADCQQPDKAIAANFLDALTAFAPHLNKHRFIALHDTDKSKKPRVWFGTLDEHWEEMRRANAEGFGIFFSVNATRGADGANRDVQAIRAVWRDNDSGSVPASELPLPPHIVVQSSPGKTHEYWLANVSADDHERINRAIAEKFEGDRNATNLARVLRLPGTLHQKGAPHLVTYQVGLGQFMGVYATPHLEAAFGPLPERPAPTPYVAPLEPDAAYIDALRDALRHIPAEARDVWFKVGAALHYEFEGRDSGREIWDEWSRNCPEKFEARSNAKTWDGYAVYRSKPTTIATVIALARENGWSGHLPARNAAEGLDPVSGPHQVATTGQHGGTRDDFASRFKPAGLPIEALATIPRRQWVVHGMLARGEVTLLVAPGGAGKSQLTLALAAAVASGGGADGGSMGFEVRDDGPVLLINAEDSAADIHKRLGAIQLLHGTDVSALPIVNFDQDGTAPFRVSSRGGSETPEFESLVEHCKAAKPALIVLDPLASLHSEIENDNVAMDAFVRKIIKLARVSNAAVLLVHHTNKPAKTDKVGQHGDANASRGASAIANACRLVLTLQGADPELAGRYGIQAREAHTCIRLDAAKANHAEKGGPPRVFRIRGVKLPNGDTAPALEAVKVEALNHEDSERIVLAAITDAAACKRPYAANGKRRPAPERIDGVTGLDKAAVNDALNALAAKRAIVAKNFIAPNRKGRLSWFPVDRDAQSEVTE